MKTIHQIELVKKISHNPMPFIGQRSLKLFDAYLLPFHMFSHFDVPQADKTVINNYPSIAEEVESTYGLQLGTRHWSWPFQYNTEDERSHFETSVKLILEYEKKYPNPNHADYCLKLNQDLSNELQKYIGTIAYRPGLYFGKEEMACFRAFIDGFYCFKEYFGLAHTDFDKQLLQFIEQYKIEGNRDFKTWDRNYRAKWDLAIYGINEKHAISKFMYDVERYTGFKLKPITNNEVMQVDWSRV